MNEIYRFNPDARYSPKQWPGGINLSTHMQIYVNEYQYVTVDFPNIFSDYQMERLNDWWPMPNKLFYKLQMRPPKLEEYFGFYRCQLNFAIYAATSALGISKQHLMQRGEMLKKTYKLVYYHNTSQRSLSININMPPKAEVFTFNQIREIMDRNEETLMRFFNSAVDRMEKKIKDLVEENILLKKELSDLKESVQFHSDLVEVKIKDVDEKLKSEQQSHTREEKLKEVLKRNNQLEEKVAELEDRSRRNNLRFDGILESEDETWKQSEEKIKEIIKEKLGLKEEFKIERAHRSGRQIRQDQTRNSKRTIVARFLNYKDKTKILELYREKKLWKETIFINEDFSERTMEKRKELFRQAKTLRNNGKYAKVVYNKLICRERKGASYREEEIVSH